MISRALVFALASAAALLGAAVAHADPVVPPEVEAAARTSLTIPGARLVILSYGATAARGCQPQSASLPHPIDGSGRYAVKLAGVGCRGWAWLRVEVIAPVPVTTRAVKQGEPLEAAVAMEERPVSAGAAPAALAPGAVASRPLPRGRVLAPGDVRGAAGNSGEAVKVLVRNGALAIETVGRLVACGAGRACAVLASGKHVEGQLSDGRLIVEVP